MKHIIAVGIIAALILASSAYAAATLTGKDIKNGTLTGIDVKNQSLTGKDIKNRSITSADLRGNFRGPPGQQGAQGPAGPAGPSVLGQITIVKSPPVPFGSEIVVGAIASCPSGQRAISGGGTSISDEQLAATEPTNDRSGWYVIGIDQVENGGEYIQATALCVPTGQAVAASRSRARAREELGRLVAKIAAERK